MPFVSSWEKIIGPKFLEEGQHKGELIGKLKMLKSALETKFGEPGMAFADELGAVTDSSKLDIIMRGIFGADSVDELRKLL